MTKYKRNWHRHDGKSRPVSADVAVDVTIDGEEAFIDTLAGDEHGWVWDPKRPYASDRITHWRYSTMRPLPEGVEA